ncbi:MULTISPECIES: succinylglutamate desuccinylase/aspartoacylase family protein [Oceanimonas]|uniref:succinylglutamate desuccinylase/aspartoacylase family protein n=1 Tax=Oceanimonas TaxID=129577 RepID=UPI0003629D6D|nr:MULTISPECIES: succinylglutamate desuccinylase/aspartoacylase family protein [Oceanimonas]MDV2858318.1 succinylglutamate desuccinylase/aspartoacylase family protein [Oceanimonas sp. CAM02]
MSHHFELAGQSVPAGQRRTMQLALAQLYTQSPLTVPVEVVNGKQPGPVLLLCAAIHGDELNGIEVVNQVLAKINPARLKGTLVAVPVVNVFGFIHKSRYLPDRRDLNRCFPGSEKGSLGARVAHFFVNEIVSKCSHIIDLHTGAIHRANLPQIRAQLDCPVTRQMAENFGAPIILDASIRDGSLRAVAEAQGVPVILYEAGEALRFDPLPIKAGVRGVIRVMRGLGMLKSSTVKSASEAIIARSSTWIRAEHDGLLHLKVRLGDRIRKGDILGTISAPLGAEQCLIVAPRSGIVIGSLTMPLVNEGDAICHIALFDEIKQAELTVERFVDELDIQPPAM